MLDIILISIFDKIYTILYFIYGIDVVKVNKLIQCINQILYNIDMK